MASLTSIPSFFVSASDMSGPATITIPAELPFTVRRAGSVLKERTPIAAPLETRTAEAPLIIMRDLVTRADYAHCVADRACAPSLPDLPGDMPQTNVNFDDATAYSRWLAVGRTCDRLRIVVFASVKQKVGARRPKTVLLQESCAAQIIEFGNSGQNSFPRNI
jgi:hypothetical protein